jgi:hypothetical protein
LDKYCLMLHLKYKGNFVRNIRIESIHLKLRLGSPFDSNVDRVEVKNPILYWTVKEIRSELSLILSETVHLIGLNSKNERVGSHNFYVEIPVRQIVFSSDPMPRGIYKTGNFGPVLVTLVRQVGGSLYPRRQSDPPRYDAPPHYVAPSAPIGLLQD